VGAEHHEQVRKAGNRRALVRLRAPGPVLGERAAVTPADVVRGGRVGDAEAGRGDDRIRRPMGVD